MTTTEIIADHLTRTRYEDLSGDAVKATKQHIMHTLATVMAGSSAAGCGTVVNLVGRWGGKPESAILVYGNKVPCPQAALANSCMAHARDFCNNDDRIAYKSSVCAVPAALATAQALGGISGRDLILATCLGVDLGIRIGLATCPKPVHATAPMLGPFASAAAAARILGLDRERMVSALGLALGQCRASGTSTDSDSLTKRLGPGLAASGGVFAAFLAAEGYPTQKTALEGARGYFQIYYRQEGDLQQLLSGLGKSFEIVNVGPKPYPSCRFTHASIDAALALVKENDLAPQDVAAVTVYLGRQDYEAVGVRAGGEAKRHPRSVVEAQFSVPWTVASAIVKRRVFIDDFVEDALTNSQVLGMTDKVSVVMDARLDLVPRVIKPAIVEIKTTRGQTRTRRIEFPKGSPENPVAAAEIRDNFIACAQFAARSLDRGRVEQAAGMIERLETIDDVSAIADLLGSLPK